jgi:hypothetical protein
MGAEYLSYVKAIATFAFTFYWYTILFLANVQGVSYARAAATTIEDQ